MASASGRLLRPLNIARLSSIFGIVSAPASFLFNRYCLYHVTDRDFFHHVHPLGHVPECSIAVIQKWRRRERDIKLAPARIAFRVNLVGQARHSDRALDM